MAGQGKRMRPHTLTTPKPLLPVGGKPIVKRLIEDISKMAGSNIDEIAFVVGDFGKEVENELLNIAQQVGAKGSIHYQDQPLGTAHAILCAEAVLNGNVFIAFADTLFKADVKIDLQQDGIIYTKKIENPEAFGVVVTDENKIITKLVEKPKTFVSDLAIIGIYYFKDGEGLKKELKYIIDQDIKDKGEFQLTTAMENMKNKGLQLKAETVELWLDCGNKNATVDTNQKVLKINKNEKLISDKIDVKNSVIIEPCFIDDNVKIHNSVIGPYTSIGKGTEVEASIIKNSIVLENTLVSNAVIENSMIGKNVIYKDKAKDLSIGDYTVIN